MARRISGKPNWFRCGFCDKPILTRRVKGSNKLVTLSRTPVYIIIDPSSPDTFYYGGEWVQGREVSDGLVAYRKHKCPCMRK